MRLILVWMCLLMAPHALALSDPTRPLLQVSPDPEVGDAEQGSMTKPQWTLRYIRINGADRLAEINGQRVREGDRLAGAKVLRIRAGSVRLRGNGGEMMELKIGYPDIKTGRGPR